MLAGTELHLTLHCHHHKDFCSNVGINRFNAARGADTDTDTDTLSTKHTALEENGGAEAGNRTDVVRTPA